MQIQPYIRNHNSFYTKNVQYNSTPLYVYVCIFDYLFLFSLMMLKRNITYRNTVVHKKSNASFLFFFSSRL